jgi:uncharacterized protein
MILRDPIHGLVAFEHERERIVKRLLATREVQRLRRVRQLGLASLVFPGAEHSRFAHAIGTAHVMGRLLDRIGAVEHAIPKEQRLDDEARRDALAAALLHDLGHGPFSHLFEEVFAGAPRHEDWTVALILDPATEVHAALSELGAGTPARVAALVEGKHRLAYLGHAVSGTLDVDRCDYLLRDSHMTGVRYGIYDLDWLLRALTFGCVRGQEWVLAIEGRKGLPPIEGFFLARSFMYQQVYHHKATRAAEALIRGIFLRVASLIRAGRVPQQTPPAIVAAVSGEPVRLSEYLALDDITLLHAFRVWEQDADPALADLTRRLQLRQLPKTVPLPPEARDTGVWQRAEERAREIAIQHGYQPELVVWLDVANEAPYTEPDDESAEGLWVSLRHRPMTRLGRISFMLGELRNKRVERPRLIFPAEIREKVLAAVASVIDAPAS